MENDYNIVKRYIDPNSKYFINPSTQFVALEKIHGTNYSFMTDGSTVIPAKRTSSLGNDRSYYGHGACFIKYRDDVITLFNALKLSHNNLQFIQLYCELFGGHYNGKSNNGSKVVQKGMNYCADNEIMAYDVKLIFNNELPSVYLDFDELELLFQELYLTIKLVPIIAKNTLAELMKLNPKFESEVYKYFNLSKLENNWAEGFVIKPCKEIVIKIINKNEDNNEFLEEDRIIFKYKNPSFGEVIKSNPSKNMTYQQMCFEELKLYVNQMRFNNLSTKLSDEEDKTNLITMMLNDILVDFKADHDNYSNKTELVNNEDNVIANTKALSGYIKGFVLKRI
jgi:Rnl2 family RNA ligase